MSDLVFIGELSVASTWQQSKKLAASGVQTSEAAGQDAEVQTTVSALQVMEQLDKNYGTEDRQQAIPSAHCDGTQWIYSGQHYDAGKLSAFLKEVELDLVAELNANTKSTAFDRYEPNWKDKLETISLSLTLTPSFAHEGEWHATCLSWNSTGTSLAIGYGRIDTVTWCSSKGYVCVWHITKPDLDPNVPHVTLEADSYVGSLVFHPTKGSQLAAGTYNGEVLIWDVSEENPRPLSSVLCTAAPREPVTRLQWLLNVRETREQYKYVLCSGSQDGKILFWTPTNQLQDVLASYDVQNRKRNIVGVLSMGFVYAGSGGGAKSIAGVENLMLFGTETGEVFRTKPGAAVADKDRPKGASRAAILEIDHFETHLGPVHSVDCSPFFRNLFLTGSSDGSVRIYSTLERHPLLSLEPSTETKHFVYAAQWSPYRPSVIAAASRNGSLYIYDLEKSKTKASVTVDAGMDGAPLCSLVFNKNDSSLLATGDVKGNVRIWKIATELTQPTDLERAAVRYSEGGAAAAAAAAASAKKGDNKEVEADPEAAAGSNPARDLFGFSV